MDCISVIGKYPDDMMTKACGRRGGGEGVDKYANRADSLPSKGA